MVFFQAVLLAGYGYAHLTTRLMGPKKQAVLHIVVLAVAAVVLPIAVDTSTLVDSVDEPMGPLLFALVMAVGFPFLALSASAPMFQRWFGCTDHEDAADPYHLYAASNAGSMLSLLAYPLLIEPALDLTTQSNMWAIGYGVLGVLTIAVAGTSWKRIVETGPEVVKETAPLTAKQRLHWIALAFIPSSLLLGVTTTLSTDIAAVPLLWVIPLALYLLTFILVFAKTRVIPHALVLRITPMILVMLVPVLVLQLNTPMWLMVLIHLGAFFAVTMTFHGELNRTRPAVEHLTEFYLLMSLGGVLGGAFNALLAPLVFPDVYEYPLMVAVAALLMPIVLPEDEADKRKRMLQDIVIVAALLGILLLVERKVLLTDDSSGLGLALVMLSFIPFVLMYMLRPIAFGAGLTIAVVMGYAAFAYNYPLLYLDRSYFGSSKVVFMEDDNVNMLLHGNTNHGAQSRLEEYRHWSLPYLYPGSPIGQVFKEVQRQHGPAPVGAIGLGVGGISCLASKGQPLRFYEIDPVVVDVASDPQYFSFMTDCEGDYDVVKGDGRIMISREDEGAFQLVVVDAFTSNAIPVHLVTTEAIELYMSKLRDDGVLAFHISNRYLDLEPMLANIVEKLGLKARVQLHKPPKDIGVHLSMCKFMLIARDEAHMGELANDPNWREPRRDESVAPWTDTFSNVISLYRWE